MVPACKFCLPYSNSHEFTIKFTRSWCYIDRSPAASIKEKICMKQTIMAKEAAQSPQVIQQQLLNNAKLCEQIGQTLRANPPQFVYIIGRGSSDHAGVFAKYLIEVELGIPVCSAAPSVSSLFNQQLALKNALVLCISQSGKSPDILAQAKAAQQSGATCIALVNDESSPLAILADEVVPLCAGEEKAVAATKSYLATLSAILQLVAAWAQSTEILSALNELPEHLQKAIEAPAQLSLNFVQPLRNCVVLGRGFGYAISCEIALKLKEVCGIHAEAFSSAEFLHGPATLVSKQLAIIDIDLNDETSAAHRAQVAEMKKRGAIIIQLTGLAQKVHPRLAPMTILQRFYLDVEQISAAMGLNPDAPEGLNKVTQTL
jgi:glucosamine--fructose-6-phosphate aminotransferase (isomerizing)